ncbi:DMT family transporter [Sulfuricurvum sp.]|uniref:DMT family transporter n=1 Tax=Sulfuricurvum sp. TaxID=2025608 RepID=UPI002E33DE35|nr:DMT family transporter [Sulfuricurvum sp.]HEX5330034.1 DMT family transporter [Sulfuricurvum sp.]
MISSPNTTRRGIAFMLIASFLFALTMVFAKLLSHSMGSVEVTFWRNAIGLALIGAFILHKPIRNIGGKPVTLIFRGVVGTVALLAFFYTVSATSLSNAIVYAKTEPIFTALLAFLVLGEKLKPNALIAVFIGFAGVAMLSGMEMGYLHVMGILCGFLSALAYTSVRSLKSYYDERTVVLSFMISGVVIPLILMVVAEYTTSELFAFALSPFTMPMGMDWLWIALMGISAAYGQIYMTRAYFYAKAGIVSTVSYSVVLFATFFGVLLGDVLPTPMVIGGGVMIILSGVLLSRAK